MLIKIKHIEEDCGALEDLVTDVNLDVSPSGKKEGNWSGFKEPLQNRI